MIFSDFVNAPPSESGGDAPAGFRAAKTELKTRRAGVLPLGTRRGGAVTGTAKHRPRWGR